MSPNDTPTIESGRLFLPLGHAENWPPLHVSTADEITAGVEQVTDETVVGHRTLDDPATVTVDHDDIEATGVRTIAFDVPDLPPGRYEVRADADVYGRIVTYTGTVTVE